MSKLSALLFVAFLLQAQEEPIFRAGTHVLQVDVIVRDKRGPVAGLSREDFKLFDQGKPRKIVFFSVNDGRNLSPKPASLAQRSADNTSSGQPVVSATALLIDRLNTPVSNQPIANRRVVEFLQKRKSSERLGIFALGTSLSLLQDLTNDSDQLTRAAKGLKVGDARKISPDVSPDLTGNNASDAIILQSLDNLDTYVVEDRVRTTALALETIAHHLERLPGRKNLIWVSATFPLLIVKPHETLDFSEDVGRAARALNTANVAVYPVDARGLIGAQPISGSSEQRTIPPGNCTGRGPCVMVPLPQNEITNGADTMNTIAGMTGGKAFYNSNGIEDSIKRAVEDAQLTYTLGFYPAAEDLDDKYHKLTVKVDRRGVEVRSRQGYAASKVIVGAPWDAQKR